MCDLHDHLSGDALAEDDFVLDTPVVRTLVAAVQEEVAQSPVRRPRVRGAAARVRGVLSRRDWLPEEFQHDVPKDRATRKAGAWAAAWASGCSTAAADRSLPFSLVVPPGEKTPIHDHLAWGLIGLYRGPRTRRLPSRRGTIELCGSGRSSPATTTCCCPRRRHPLRATTSDETSVSIHLLANDTGCALRHTFDEATGEAKPFRSGYANAACPEPSAEAVA